MNRDVKRLCDDLAAKGLTVQMVSSGHLKVTLPDGRFVWTIPKSPSDPRALRNCRTAINRRLTQLGHTSGTGVAR